MIDDSEPFRIRTPADIARLAARICSTPAVASRAVCFGRLSACRESPEATFFAKADLDRLRDQELAELRLKCSKMSGTETEKLSVFNAEICARENGRATPNEQDRERGQMIATSAMQPRRSAVGGVRLRAADGQRIRMRLSAGGMFQ
jgi:hypothetical protein